MDEEADNAVPETHWPEADSELTVRQHMDRVLRAEAARPNPQFPRGAGFSRKEVAEAFTQAFHMIGGAPRLALWANENEGDFFKLFARFAPKEMRQGAEDAQRPIIPATPHNPALDGDWEDAEYTEAPKGGLH